MNKTIQDLLIDKEIEIKDLSNKLNKLVSERGILEALQEYILHGYDIGYECGDDLFGSAFGSEPDCVLSDMPEYINIYDALNIIENKLESSDYNEWELYKDYIENTIVTFLTDNNYYDPDGINFYKSQKLYDNYAEKYHWE